jgi:hypothetical protein
MGWNDELMPALITARTRQQTVVVRQLRGCLLDLPKHGIEAFRFKDLLDLLKRDARERWAALLEKEEKGAIAPSLDTVQVPASALPGSNVESQQSFEDLTRSISTSIDRMEADPRTRAQLTTLWQYLWQQHEEGREETSGDKLDEGKNRTRLPSYRQLGQRLNISRERLPVLFALLRQLISR